MDEVESDELWNKAFNETRNFIDHFSRYPQANSEDEKEATLGAWAHLQGFLYFGDSMPQRRMNLIEKWLGTAFFGKE